MENAPSYVPVYTDPGLAPDVDPDSVRAYLLSGNCLPLALVAVEPTPGQIRLVRPVPLPDDPQHAVSLQRILDNIRVLRQNLVIAGDSKALLMQEANFTFLTCLLMKERGLGAIANWWWSRMFASRTVVALAESLYERHGDVGLRTDLGTAEFSLCGPNSRVRQRDEVIVSLRPVVDALSIMGLWVDRPDERFRDLARVMVRLGQDEHQHVGRTEFIGRHGRGEQ